VLGDVREQRRDVEPFGVVDAAFPIVDPDDDRAGLGGEELRRDRPDVAEAPIATVAPLMSN
jgi:hypothetical protein